MPDSLIRSHKSLADIVHERLLRAIRSGVYRPDDKLPAEHDLVAEFGVSRPVVREALRRLREQGLICSRRGSGSFVCATERREPPGPGQPDDLTDLLQCYEFRLTVEAQAAACAAERHSPEALGRIASALAGLRDARERQIRREDANFRFHHAIAIAAGNDYFVTAVTALQDHVAAGARLHGGSAGGEAPGPDHVLAEHVAIHDAIRNRDPEAARQLMCAHLASSRERFFAHRPTGTGVH